MALTPLPDGNYGNGNTAEGQGALENLDINTGQLNTAVGGNALNKIVSRQSNTAVGNQSLANLEQGDQNTAFGKYAAKNIETGDENTSIGAMTHQNLVNGIRNTALGFGAGLNVSGNFNISIDNEGIEGESNTIRIGNSVRHSKTFIAGIYGVAVEGLPVVINSDGKMGTMQIIPAGTILRIASGTPAPVGFTLIGTETLHYNDTTGHPTLLTVNLYQKN